MGLWQGLDAPYVVIRTRNVNLETAAGAAT